jgi:hypothetical protein
MMLYSIGFYFIYQNELQSVKDANHSAIEAGKYSDDLTTIRIAYSNGKYQDKALEVISNAEIIWHGKMYDVVSSRIEGQTMVFTCLTDNKETNMIGSVNDHIQKQSDQPSGKKTISIAKNINLYFEEQLFVKVDPGSILSQWSLPVIKVLPAPYYNIPSPPPWNS